MKKKLFLLLCTLLTMIGVQNVKADVVPTPSTPTAGNSYYLYNPKTKSFLVSDGYSNDGTPYVRSLGQAWAVEASDKDGYIKLRRKDKETGYFWGKYWALVGSNYSDYPNETYFRLDLIPETSNYHIYANSWDGTANAFVYVNSSNSNRVACNSQEQSSLDADYTVWQFITEADYARYAKEANITYSFSELSPVDYTTKGSAPTGGHTYVLYNETKKFMYDDANTPKVSSSQYTYFTLENTGQEFYIRSDAGLLYKSENNAWTTSTNGGYGDEAKWTVTLSNGKYTLRNNKNTASEFFAPNSNGEGQICYRDKTALTGWYFIEKNKNVAISLLDALQQAKDTYYTPAPAGEAKDNLLIALNDVYVKYVIVSGFTSDIYDAGVQAINDAVLAAIESQSESSGSLTYLLSNPSFETDNAAASLMTGNTAPTGWNFSGNTTNSQWGTANANTTIQGIGTKFNPSDGDKYYYIRSNWQTNQDYTLSKTIKGLPAGVYRVSSKIARFLSHETTTYTLSLQEAGKTESKTTTTASDANWRPWQVFVKKLEDGTDLTIKANMRYDYANNGYHYQMLLDNFDFEYLGADDEENLNFATGAIPDGNEIKGYIHDISTTTMTSGMQYVPGWELAVVNGDTRAAGVMTINSGSKLNGSDVPAANYDGNSNGKVLALEAVWTGTVQYKKNVTLNAGAYEISFPIYNVAGTGTITKNLFGFIENGGTEHLATEVSFTTGNWALMTVVFNLEENTEGYLSLGYTAANAGNGSMPHLFLDRVDIDYVDPKVPARNDLQNKINEATGARKSANEGSGIFQIPAAAGTTFSNAIMAAQDVYDNEDATLDEITTATSTLNTAIGTYQATELNAPDAEKRYYIVLSNNGSWSYNGNAITYIAKGRNDMGNYNVQYLAAPNANYAQAIIFTQVEGNTYKMSQIDVDGNTRYLCTGVPYSGNTSQIRTTTTAEDALVVKIIATGTKNIFNIYNTEADQYIGSQDAGVYTVNSNKNFTIEEASKASAKMQVSGVAKMGTFCAPFDVEIPDGVKAYTLSEGTNESWVHMNEVSGTKIAAGTPVLLTSDSKIDEAMEGYSVINAPDNSGLLQGAFVLTDVDKDAGNYLLQYQDGECAFYLVNSDGKKIGANRCYLHMEESGETPARIVIGGGDDPTAINAVEATAPEANTLKDGKYLIGNKIVLVKNGVKYGANGQKLN